MVGLFFFFSSFSLVSRGLRFRMSFSTAAGGKFSWGRTFSETVCSSALSSLAWTGSTSRMFSTRWLLPWILVSLRAIFSRCLVISLEDEA